MACRSAKSARCKLENEFWEEPGLLADCTVREKTQVPPVSKFIESGSEQARADDINDGDSKIHPDHYPRG